MRGDTKLVISEHRPVLFGTARHRAGGTNTTEPEVLDLYRRDGNGEQTHQAQRRTHQPARPVGPQGRTPARRGTPRISARASAEAAAAKAPRAMPRNRNATPAPLGRGGRALTFWECCPASTIIFSRNGCDQAVEQCINAGLELTTDEEATKIRRIVDVRWWRGNSTQEDLKALQFSKFRFALEEGFASHHAGMIALFRQIVERLSRRRSGQNGVRHGNTGLGHQYAGPLRGGRETREVRRYWSWGLTPGEFTQLTGRAGRRGIDTIGHRHRG